MTFAVRGLTFRYDGQPELALDDVSFEAADGTTLAVLGLSGSGKSTLLNVLGLLWEGELPEETVVYQGRNRPYDYHELTPEDRTGLRRNEFGFVLQSAYLLSHFSCLDNVAMPLAMHDSCLASRRTKAERLLSLADPDGELMALAARPARRVSGGEKQRMAVLRAVVHDPNVVFADEPTSNLDFRSADRIVGLLRDWRAGRLSPEEEPARRRTLVFVSHSLDMAYEIADNFVVLRQGRVVKGRALRKSELRGAADLYELVEHGG